MGNAEVSRGAPLNGPVEREVSPAGTEGDSSGLLYELIATQPFFEGLGAPQLRLLNDVAMEMQFEPGRYLFRQGEPANRFYLILEGKVQLESEAGEEGLTPLRVVEPGDDPGWSWLFSPYYFHASARAVEPTRAIFFYGTRLRQQCEDDHDLGYEIMKRFSEAAVQSLSPMRQNFAERCTCAVPKRQCLPSPINEKPAARERAAGGKQGGNGRETTGLWF